MRTERGNILFLILLAVVLFAALSYAVTSSMRGGGNDGSKESNEAAAADIMGWLSLVDNSYSRMLLSSGYRAEDISFTYPYKQYNGTQTSGQVNPNCLSNACKLFDPRGGGVTPRTFENYAVATPTGITGVGTMPGYFTFTPMVWPYAGTSANDIAMIVSYIKPEICVIIAAKLGIDMSTLTRTGAWYDASNPAGWDTAGVIQFTTGLQQLSGKRTIVHQPSGVNYCTIFQLLLVR